MVLFLLFLSELEHYRLDKDKENIGFVGNARRQRVDKVFPEPDSKFSSYDNVILTTVLHLIVLKIICFLFV